MALIPCRECGHQISDTAASCPSCGAPRAEPPNSPPTEVEPNSRWALARAFAQNKERNLESRRPIGLIIAITVASGVLFMIIGNNMGPNTYTCPEPYLKKEIQLLIVDPAQATKICKLMDYYRRETGMTWKAQLDAVRTGPYIYHPFSSTEAEQLLAAAVVLYKAGVAEEKLNR